MMMISDANDEDVDECIVAYVASVSFEENGKKLMKVGGGGEEGRKLSSPLPLPHPRFFVLVLGFARPYR